MKIKLIIVFLFISCISFAQKVTLYDLINLAGYNVESFDKFVLSAGYSSYETKETDRSIREYYYDTDNYDYYAQFLLSRYEFTNPSQTVVTWSTSEPRDYLDIKTDIKSLGFSLKSTGITEKDESEVTYEKGNTEVRIITRTPKMTTGRRFIHEYAVYVTAK